MLKYQHNFGKSWTYNMSSFWDVGLKCDKMCAIESVISPNMYKGGILHTWLLTGAF